jgi:serine/threonine-protein kinase
MEGSTIGAYTVVRKLGEGGMGTVWVGEHTLLGRRAAIKVLLPEFTSREEIVQRFFNEARAVTAIADPGIVQVFDFGHAHGSAYIVMELLEGEAMDERLRRIGRFAPADAVRLMAQIATSLGAAHAKGVTHRDLKPENIFIVGDPAVTGGERTKILDFGIAKLAGDEASKVKTRTGMMMGTPVYMSPEQCRGAASIDSRSDIYALGCVLFTMVCGRPPFESETTGDLIIMHVRDAPPLASQFVPGLPPELDMFIARCLEKDPNRRFQTTAEMVQGLAAVEGALFGSTASGGVPGQYRPHLTPAAAMAYRQQPTPAPPDAATRFVTAPQAGTTPPQGPSPTTLSMSNGATTAASPRRSKTGLIAGVVIGVLGVGGGVFALALRGGKSDGTAATTQPATQLAPPADAASVAVPTPPVAVPVDAGMEVVAAPPVEVAALPDAGVVATKKSAGPADVRPKSKSHKTSTTRPTAKTGSASTGSVDRGD